MRLGFAGTPAFAVPALDALLQSRHEVCAVFTQPDRRAGRGRLLQMSAVKTRALERGIPVHQPATFKTPDAQALLRALRLDAFVVVAFGMILPPQILDIPSLGCLNIHASLLPRWRGAAPIQRALLAGDTVTGVTIMRMDAGLDTGPMLVSRSLTIDPRETAGTLHDRLAQIGGELIIDALQALAAGTAREEPQPASGFTYAAKIDKSEALIDWHQDAAHLVSKVRAFNPWPVAETRLNGAQLRVWEAELATQSTAGGSGAPGTVLQATGEGIEVACGRGSVRVLRLQLAGRKPLAAREFSKAHALVGMAFADS